MPNRQPRVKPAKSTHGGALTTNGPYLSEPYDVDQSSLYNALSVAGFGRDGDQQINHTLLDAVSSAAGIDLPVPLVLQQGDATNHQEATEEAVSLLDQQKTTHSKGRRKKGSDAPPPGASSVTQQHQFNFRTDTSVTMSNRAKRQRTNQQGRLSTPTSPAHDANGTYTSTMIPNDAPGYFNQYTSSFNIPGTKVSEHTEQSMPFSPNDDANGVDASTVTNDTSVFFSEYTSPLSKSDSKAPGVYSAAALFRKPTEASRKYTRPPMSKLFTSLELTPENFITLQSAAKAYMLDPKYEERQNCVGNRHKLEKFDLSKGDTDMTKLRLYHCVKEFLDDGPGERYFGEQSEGAAWRSWLWPRDTNKVISLVTPLLRRMITNERQRQYALETRKTPNSGGRPTRETDPKQASNSSTDHSSRSESQDLNGQLDPQLASLGKIATRSSVGTQQPLTTENLPAHDPIESLRFSVIRGATSEKNPARRFLYAINKDYHDQNFREICDEAKAAYDRYVKDASGGSAKNKPVEEPRWTISALIDSGRKDISNEADWEEAVDAASTEMPYINGELTVVIEFQ